MHRDFAHSVLFVALAGLLLGVQAVDEVIVSVPGGVYPGGIPPVELSCSTPGTMILYTLDDSEPDMAGMLWDGTPLDLQAPVTLRARGLRFDREPGPIAAERYQCAFLPVPLPDVPSGTVFSGAQEIALAVPGFGDDSLVHLSYTLDGSAPHHHGIPYDGAVRMTRAGVLRVCAKRRGYCRSQTGEYEYFCPYVVARACYRDNNGDGRIETVDIRFDRACSVAPSMAEFSDPFSHEGRRVNREDMVCVGNDERLVRVTLVPPFAPGAGFPGGHYGRIPLPGEFDTAPFLVHDSTSTASGGPGSMSPAPGEWWVPVEGDLVVLHNPFEPGRSRLPALAREMSGFLAETGTAVVIMPLRPSTGTAIIYDAVGNVVMSARALAEESLTGALFLVWDGMDIHGGIVAGGTYLAIVTLEEKQNHRSSVRRVSLAVKR